MSLVLWAIPTVSQWECGNKSSYLSEKCEIESWKNKFCSTDLTLRKSQIRFQTSRVFKQTSSVMSEAAFPLRTEGLFHCFDRNLFSHLDKIAIPDFGTGAMENWGLITYRETNLLYDPQESAASNKQRVAAVVAHELVHQVQLAKCFQHPKTQFHSWK